MATPRSQLVDSCTPLYYHLVSRCVRRSWLCGTDRVRGRSYDHRKEWLESRLLQLSACFAVELFGYAIMNNHFHLVVRYDPLAAARWSDDEVATRWSKACALPAPPKHERLSMQETADWAERQRANRRAELLSDPVQLERARETLGSLSLFMKHLKQPIAWRANREDKCRGHFFESRFYSGALLDEAAVLAAMAYVDLNPVRARIVKDVVTATHTSIHHRVEVAANDPSRLDEYLEPLASGVQDGESSRTQIPITLRDYIEQLSLGAKESELPIEKTSRWYQRIVSFKHRQRAYGNPTRLFQWTAERGWSRTGIALS